MLHIPLQNSRSSYRKYKKQYFNISQHMTFNVPTIVNNCYPIDCTPLLYLDIVLFWPYDGFLQSTHVAKILKKYCQFADIYKLCF